MRIEVHEIAVQDLRALPDELRKTAQDVLLELLAVPIPEQAEPYAGIPNAYRLDAGLIVSFYLVIDDGRGGVIDVRRVRPNS
jgi:hypothetical protein